jgi:uncharacterized iron-regulated protein
MLCLTLAVSVWLITVRAGNATVTTETDCPPIIIDVYAGEPVSLEMMMDDLASVRIIYLGEFHTISRHHEVQYLILKSLFHRGLKLSLGMEMFPATRQGVLDGWLESADDLDSLANELGRDRWTNIRDYERLLLFARQNRIPVLGLNASDSLVRKVARGQLSELSEAEQKHLPQDLDDLNLLYERLLRLKLRVHKAFHEKSLEHVVRAQASRDSVMALSIVTFLTSSQGRGSTMVVIAGSGHLNYGFGVPERVRKKIELPDRIVLPTESGQLILSEEEKRQAVPVEITHQDLAFIRVPIADYLHVLPLKNVRDENGLHSAREEMAHYKSNNTLQSSEE